MRHSYRRAVTTSLTAARYYWRKRALQPRVAGPTAGRLPRLNSWTCVRLVPTAALRRPSAGDDTEPPARSLPIDGTEHGLSAELTIVRSPQGDIVRTSLGDFIPGVYTYTPPDFGWRADDRG